MKSLEQMLVSPQGISAEPFVLIPSNQNFKNHSFDSYVTINQQRRQRQKFEFYLNSFDFIKENNINGDYYEFGCHRGRTFRMALAAARFYMLDDMNFHGFDSFEGLPDLKKLVNERWLVGSLATSEYEFRCLVDSLQIFQDRIVTHKGFYGNALTKEKQAQLSGRRASFICVDCDFYESAVSVFNFIEPFLQHGTIIYLDDVYSGFALNSQGGVLEAFRNFRSHSAFDFVEHMSVGWWGKSFIATMTKT